MKATKYPSGEVVEFEDSKFFDKEGVRLKTIAKSFDCTLNEDFGTGFVAFSLPGIWLIEFSLKDSIHFFIIERDLDLLNFVKEYTPIVRDHAIIDFMQDANDAANEWKGKELGTELNEDCIPYNVFRNINSIRESLHEIASNS